MHMESRIQHLTFVTTVLGNGADTRRSMELDGQSAKPNLETSKSMRNPLLRQKVERETLSQRNKVEILFQRVRWRTSEGTWTTHTLALTHTMEIILGYLSFYLFILLSFLFLATVKGFMVSAQLSGNRPIPSALWIHVGYWLAWLE